MKVIPFNCRYAQYNFNIKGYNTAKITTLKTINETIDSLNIVLDALIPGEHLVIQYESTPFIEDSEEKQRFTIWSARGNTIIPLKWESEGLIKLVSILSLYIAAFNEDSFTIAIDEIDAGVFEHLLDVLFKAFDEQGKGQFIFTSHNLRPIEVLNRLSVCQLEEGKELFDEDVVDINSIIVDTAANYAFTAEEKGIELICECEKEAKVWGDEIKLQQMIQNLVINAVQHTSHGYVRISSSVADKKVQITVADTGEGIAEEDLQFVFERYYTSRKSRGSNSSGLGLAIAKEIAEAHKGEISVETARGSGSTFSVILPQL